MATFVSLCNFTDQGIRSVKDTVKRADAAADTAHKFGCSLNVYWTRGQYDLIAIVEAPDEATAATFALAIEQAGNIRFETLRAFTRDEMQTVLSKLP
jgi:uncharacterized protein with GYD domain